MHINTHRAPVRLFPIVATALALAASLGAGPAAAQSNAELDKLSTEVQVLKQGQQAMQKDITEIKKMLEGVLARGRPKPFRPLDLSLAGAPSQGASDAPVTLVEFTDFQCPFCRRYFRTTLPQLIKQYVDTGKVRYVVRQMPLTRMHSHAEKAAEAALCAAEQGKFWQMHNALFQDQTHLKPEDLTARATKLGLDMPKFSHCLDSGAKANAVQQDLKAGSHAGVHGTPTFFLGRTNSKAPDKLHATRMITGARPVSAFAQAIDALLASPKPTKKAGGTGS
jgi:protein-disulfide isomerase